MDALMTQPTFDNTLLHFTATDLKRVETLYDEHYEHHRTISFPGYRKRHRLLKKLTGVYPLTHVVPGWWYTMIDDHATYALRNILRQITGTEFYEGVLSKERARLLKEAGLQFGPPRPEWAQSPKLSRILRAILPDGIHSRYYRTFEQRGTCKDTPLIISDHPWDILTMGVSRHYTSCQHLSSDATENKKLPANLLDSGMVVAYIPDEQVEDRWQLGRFHTRVILRLLFNAEGEHGILVDRFYGDIGHKNSIKQTLPSLLTEAGLRMWQPQSYKEQSSECCNEGMRFQAWGHLQAFGRYRSPYLDQDACFWKEHMRGDRDYKQLSASVVEASSLA